MEKCEISLTFEDLCSFVKIINKFHFVMISLQFMSKYNTSLQVSKYVTI